MKRFIVIAVTSIFPIFMLAQKTIDVFLIGGQSNASGQGIVKNIPASFQINHDVLFYYSKFLNQGEGSETWKELCQASENKEKFGVELSMGTALKKYFPDKNIALVKHALSGSTLYNQWNPGNRTAEKRGPEYEKFMQTVNASLQKLKEMGYQPVIRAMVWQQGEADARESS